MPMVHLVESVETVCRTETAAIDAASCVVDALSAVARQSSSLGLREPGPRAPMADADAVFAGITRRPGTATWRSCRTRGLDRAIAARVTTRLSSRQRRRRSAERSTSPSTSPGSFTRRRACDAGGRPRCAPLDRVRLPVEGAVPIDRVDHDAPLDLGAYEVAVSDDRHRASRSGGRSWIGWCRPSARTHRAPLPLPRHGARERARGADLGIATFDASAGGSGMPLRAGARRGNLATEDLLYMLNGLGLETASIRGRPRGVARDRTRRRPSPALALRPRGRGHAAGMRADVDGWIAARQARHRGVHQPRVRRPCALGPLRRTASEADRSPLDSAAKRAAFGVLRPLHFSPSRASRPRSRQHRRRPVDCRSAAARASHRPRGPSADWASVRIAGITRTPGR